ncbi:MAG: hypothetical protein HY904_10760 [Deltaproteobacteria bacterium]|nr:hypothetical protein [Deltaproteobacteria bacterium]
MVLRVRAVVSAVTPSHSVNGAGGQVAPPELPPDELLAVPLEPPVDELLELEVVPDDPPEVELLELDVPPEDPPPVEDELLPPVDDELLPPDEEEDEEFSSVQAEHRQRTRPVERTPRERMRMGGVITLRSGALQGVTPG